MDPLVSVCLPNLNTLPYLRERVDTILGQTYKNWELVISDNYSSDGSWELFENLARQDPRIFAAQASRQGMYANWNNCVRRAKGKYVYIATSDDTMASDCLEKLVGALEEHSECDLAHCRLKTINERGGAVSFPVWPDCTVFAQDFPELADRKHVRRAPFDGLLHLGGDMVYMSITELLIRRSLFERIGYFDSRWGSMGDRNWDMKAGLVASTVHVPDTWASWRVHATNASSGLRVYSAAHDDCIEEMIGDAVLRCEALLPPGVVAGLRTFWLGRSREMRRYYAGLRQRHGLGHRRLFQVSQVFRRGGSVRAEIAGRLWRRARWPDRVSGEIRDWLESLGLGPTITCLS